ncbi:MAG: hypothetical protein E3J64_07040 [Anaerolineales bacterium]|nr:MAG: hypothetical protein E3J64_07040 [Anaerolineales bacterium]
MTRTEAIMWVREHDDDDDLDDDELVEAYTALYGAPPDDYDRQVGLWSHCCAHSDCREQVAEAKTECQTETCDGQAIGELTMCSTCAATVLSYAGDTDEIPGGVPESLAELAEAGLASKICESCRSQYVTEILETPAGLAGLCDGCADAVRGGAPVSAAYAG